MFDYNRYPPSNTRQLFVYEGLPSVNESADEIVYSSPKATRGHAGRRWQTQEMH